jgi:hypothetical protein
VPALALYRQLDFEVYRRAARALAG